MMDSKEGEITKEQRSQQAAQEPSKTTKERPNTKESDDTPSEQQEKNGSKKKYRLGLPRLASAAVKMYLVPTPVHRPSEDKKIAIESSMEEEQYRTNEERSKCSYFFSKILSVLPYLIIGFVLGMAVHFLLEFRALVNDRSGPQMPASLVDNVPSFNSEQFHMNYLPYQQSNTEKEEHNKGADNPTASESPATAQSETPTTSTTTTEARASDAEGTSTKEPALSIKVKTDFLNPTFSKILSKLMAPISDPDTPFMKDPLFSETDMRAEKDDETGLLGVDSPVTIFGSVHSNSGTEESEMKNVIDNAMKGLLGKLFGQNHRSVFRPAPLQPIMPDSSDAEKVEIFRILPPTPRDIPQAPPPFVMEQISKIVKNVPGKIKSVRVTSSFTQPNLFQRLFKHSMGPGISDMIPEDETIYPEPPFKFDQDNSMSVMRPRAIFGPTVISRPSNDNTVRLFPFISQSRPESLSQIDSELRELPERKEEEPKILRLSPIPASPFSFPRVTIERLPPPIVRLRPFQSSLLSGEQLTGQRLDVPEVQQEQEVESSLPQQQDRGSNRVLLKDIINARNPFSNNIFRNDRPDFSEINFPPFPDMPVSPQDIPDSPPERENHPVLVHHRRIPPFQLLNRFHGDSPRQHRRIIAIPRDSPLNNVEDSQHRTPNWIDDLPERHETEETEEPEHLHQHDQHRQSEEFMKIPPEGGPRPFFPLPILGQLPPNTHTIHNSFKQKLDQINKDDRTSDLQADFPNRPKVPSLFLPFLSKVLPALKPLNRNRHQFDWESEPAPISGRDESALPDIVVPEEPSLPEPENDGGIWDADSYSSYEALSSDTTSSLPKAEFAAVPGADHTADHSPSDQNDGHKDGEDGGEDLTSKYPEFSSLPAEIIEPLLEIDSQTAFDTGTEDLNEAEKIIFPDEVTDMEVQNDKIQEHVVFPVEPAKQNTADSSDLVKITPAVNVFESGEEGKQIGESSVGVGNANSDANDRQDQRGMVDVDSELEAID